MGSIRQNYSTCAFFGFPMQINTQCEDFRVKTEIYVKIFTYCFYYHNPQTYADFPSFYNILGSPKGVQMG